MALISKSKSYILSAWRNNQIRLKATQGEGGIKSAQFILTDDNGNIDLSTASSVLYNATKHDGSACSINCEIIDAVNGIISFTIESGITDISGEVRGSIEVIADKGNVKFDGITVFVEEDTTGELIEASDSFSALTDALNKVSNLTPEGTILLDDSLTDEGVNAVQGSAIKAYVDNSATLFVNPSSTQLIKLTDVDTTINGLNIVIKNNHISIKGTAKSDINISIGAEASIKIEKGISEFSANTDYTVSAQNLIDNTPDSYVGVYLTSSSEQHMSVWNNDNSKTVNLATSTAISMSWNISAGTYDKEFDFKIEYGTVTTPFEPYYVVNNIENNSVNFNKLTTDVQNTINSKAKSSMFLKQSDTQLINIKDTEITLGDFSISIKNNHIKVFGTLEESLSKYISISDGISVLNSNTEYTVSFQNVVDNTSDLDYVTMSLWDAYSNSDSQSVQIIGSDKSLTVLPTEDKKLQLGFVVPVGTYDKEFDFQIEYGTKVTPFEPFYVVGNIANSSIGLDKLDDEVIDKVKLIENKASYYKIEDITGETVSGFYNLAFSHNSASSWECIADFIECQPGDIFRVTSTIGTDYADYTPHSIVCYDANKNFVSKHFGLKDDKITNYCNKFFIVPDGVKYIAFNSWLYKDMYKLLVEKVTPYTDEYGIIANSLVSSIPSSELWGKKIYSDGDSIAQGSKIGNRSYAHLLADKYNMTLTSEAVGNTTLAVQNIDKDGNGDGTSIYERVVSNVTSDTQYDYIILDGGTNDITRLDDGVDNLGTITDGFNNAFDTSTVLGALEGICKHLNTTQMTAKKLFIFVTLRTKLPKLTKEVTSKMKQVLNKWGIPYVDLSEINSLATWNEDILKEYYVDEIHPSFESHKEFYFPYIEKALLYGSYGGSGGSTTSVSLTDGDKDEIVAQVIEALPDDTVGISDTNINSNGELVITYTDNSSKNLGTVVGEDGKDGISCTHSWNGTTLEIASASGTSSVDLKGEKGDSYILTDTDKTEIADIIKNEYESELLEILGGDENVTE